MFVRSFVFVSMSWLHWSVLGVTLFCCRRKKDDNVTFDTVCHNPAQKLYGLVLDDYNNSKCEMKERKGMGTEFFICSCSEDECNEKIFFNSSKFNRHKVSFGSFSWRLEIQFNRKWFLNRNGKKCRSSNVQCLVKLWQWQIISVLFFFKSLITN